jgi:hypothetical protein
MLTKSCQRIFYGDIQEAIQDFHDGVELYTNVSHEELKRIETEEELKRYIYRLWTIKPQ